MFQIFINIGMTIGIAPITGIPLPFMSYGGSHTLTNLLAIGVLQSIHVHAQTSRRGDAVRLRIQLWLAASSAGAKSAFGAVRDDQRRPEHRPLILCGDRRRARAGARGAGRGSPTRAPALQSYALRRLQKDDRKRSAKAAAVVYGGTVLNSLDDATRTDLEVVGVGEAARSWGCWRRSTCPAARSPRPRGSAASSPDDLIRRSGAAAVRSSGR